MSGTSSHGFRQITPAFNFKHESQVTLVFLSKAELRYSRNGWSSRSWGDIHPPITGSWDLVSSEEHGETLAPESFTQWKRENSEDGRRFEIVDFPQRSGRVACIYRVYFARDLGFLPLKVFRNTLAANESSTTVRVTRFKTFTIDGKQIAIPLEVQHQETQADGVSKKGQGTMTVDEDSLKVNEPLDDSLFTLSGGDDATEKGDPGTETRP